MLFKDTKIKVRPLITSDIPDLLKWLSDPNILKFYEGRDQSFDEKKIKHKFFRTLGNEDKCLVLYEGNPIGYIQYYELSAQTKSNYGYKNDPRLIFGMDQFIGETDYWNKGVGTMLIRSMVTYLFSNNQADLIVMDPIVWNERAIHVYEKCGFKKVKKLKRYVKHEGKWHDCWLIEVESNDLNTNFNENSIHHLESSESRNGKLL